MPITVGIVAPGNMGAGIGRRLADNGLRVFTSLAGRSAASLRRAETAGMQAADDAALVQSDLVLSIVPPGEAIAFAARMAPHLAAAATKPVFIDCNAISPGTVARIAAIIAPTGAAFVDGAIIGAPPQPGSKGPVLYVSGEAASRVSVLRAHALDIRIVEGGIGAASALKMSYAGITKGLTALGAAMMLGAVRAGVAEALYAELAASQPALLPWFTRQIPGMYQKAYRWVAEMEEIAAFLRDDPAAAEMFRAAARLYDRRAGDGSGSTEETAGLSCFLDQSQIKKASGKVMPQKITHGIKEMLQKAEAEVETLSAAHAVALQGRDDTVLVDLRDPREREREGVIPGAFSCTRGMLEFWVDPESPYHKPVFAQDKRFVFFCAGGMRSALAAQTAKHMGLQPVAHIEGGFKAWRDAGGLVEKLEPKPPKKG